MARRSRPVRKLLDEPLKVVGILTMRSCGIVLGVYLTAYLLDMGLGLWSRWGGEWATLGPVILAFVVAVALRLAEAHDDEHLVPSAIRFYLSGRTKCVYTAACPDGFAQRPPAWMRVGLWDKERRNPR